MKKQDSNTLSQLTSAMGTIDMAKVPGLIPADAPFDSDQRQWLNGLLAGLNAVAMVTKSSTDEEPGTPMTVLYGSQSGTCESLSKDLRKYAKTQGFEANVAALDDFDISELPNLNHLVIVAATFGEGEPTDNAINFYKALTSSDAPNLPETLNYSVCGLGDSSYADFNKAARNIDARLAELGANRVHDLTTCDVAYEDDYAVWKQETFETEAFKSAAGAGSAPEPEEAGPAFDKNHPFMATLLHSGNLNSEGSAKTVNHIELSLAGGGEDLDYAVGDALGLWPTNCMHEVQAILAATSLTGGETVQLKSGPARLQAALMTKLDLTTVTPNTQTIWEITEQSDWAQIIDVLNIAKPELTAQQLVDGLRPLQPRLYSISSSPKKHPGEVHLTVGEVHYELFGSARKGCASTFLGNRLNLGSTVGVYMQRSAHFHIPADDTVPLIMIGPGTGIAPFRAFLQEREIRGATGRNWLFFGDQHESTDYLYRNEIEGWQNSGLITNLSLAWSRDSDEKVYVQTKLKQAGAEVFAWLEEGAAIYICGDASRMASDVDKALREIIAQYGSMDEEGADAYLKKLSSEHRYQRDVY